MYTVLRVYNIIWLHFTIKELKIVIVIEMLEKSGSKITRNNWILFPLLTVATLRVSLTKETNRKITVTTQNPLTFEWFEQEVEVTYDKIFKLPNPTDEEVLVALLQVSQKTGHASREMRLLRKELMEELQWLTWSWYEKRLLEALHRWEHLQLRFDKGQIDETTGQWSPVAIPIFSRMEIAEDSYIIEWSEPVYASLRAVKYDFNLSQYQRFDNAVARRVFQLTRQTLAEQGSVEYPLREFVEKDLHLHVGYTHNKMREKLGPGLRELEEKGYIQKANGIGRYAFQRDGVPVICFQIGPHFEHFLERKPAETPNQTTPARKKSKGIKPDPGQLELTLSIRMEPCLSGGNGQTTWKPTAAEVLAAECTMA